MTVPRIVYLSANPAIDRRLRFSSVATGRVNRAKSAEAFPGGKATHVAMAAQALGMSPLWLGFLGGASGEEFASEFRTLGVRFVPVRTRTSTRTNLELLEDSGRITELLESGGSPTGAEMRNLRTAFRAALRGKLPRPLVVISGSLPPGVPSALYGSLIREAHFAGSLAFLDTSGPALRTTLSSHPEFVKLNQEEAETLLGRRLRNRAAILEAARQLIARGAVSAAVSLGAKGILWLERKNGPAWFARPLS